MFDKNCNSEIESEEIWIEEKEESNKKPNSIKGIFKILFMLICTLFCGFIMYCAFAVVAFMYILFPNLNIKEADVYKQISEERVELSVKYDPIIEYLAEYENKNGEFPEELPKELNKIKSKKFEKYKYEKVYSFYNLRVYPKHGPIEYYEKDFSNVEDLEKGKMDGFLDNEYHYKVGKNWSAVHFEFYSRYRLVNKIFFDRFY